MIIDNSLYGGFVVSKKVLDGIPIKYSYREKSTIKELNGWTIISEKDDENEYNPDDFLIVTAETLFQIAPVMFELFCAPYGTDILWKYENGVHIGFYDLNENHDISIDELVRI